MKQLICEMCGSADLIKQDGVFVCQSCGCKYSVYEAKKLMVEVAPQLENLLKLAHSSFDSGNYAKCEEFCNQIITMNAQNYEVWKLKGDAIVYQTKWDNRREVEAYDCILTSYNLLGEETNDEIKNDILVSLEKCFTTVVEIDTRRVFFGSIHLDENIISETNNIYQESYNYVFDLINSINSSDSKKFVLSSLKNAFVSVANYIVVEKYNIVFEYLKPDGEQLELKDIRYLVEFMQFVEKNFFDDTTSNELKCKIYETIVCLQSTWSGYEYGYKRETLHDSNNQYRQKYMNLISEKIKEETKDSSVTTIISKFKNKISEEKYVEAETYADVIIYKAPNSQVGYFSKALAIYGRDFYAIDRDDKEILDYLKKALQYSVSDEEKMYIKYIFDCQVGNYKKTLLMLAASQYDFDLVKYIVDEGANVNSISAENTNALWYVCSKKIDESNLQAGKRITRFLIDNGSNIDVKSSSGIDLYNRRTHPEIEMIIKEKSPSSEKGSSTGCYVATAVYGSYDCPQVWTLRRYRDYTLAESWQGRAFIKTYYAISPTLVKWFGHTEWFKKMWKGTLDRMVIELQAEGVESTPYEDRCW